MNSLVRRLKSEIAQSVMLSDKWNIGFVTDDINDVINSDTLKIHWLKHDYKDRWFADPFLLEVADDRIVVLVEEYRYKTRKGRIARLEISRQDFVLQNLKIILEEPYHLSFPVVWRKDGEVYVMPESALSGGLNIYKYDTRSFMLEKVGTVANVPLSDATIVSMRDDKKFVFSTQMPDPNGNKLQVYSFDEGTMQISGKPIDEYIFDRKIARNAGEPFYIGDQLYRPAQDCSKWYGYGIDIQKVTKEGSGFSFETIKTFHSNNLNYALGYHTLNMRDGLMVVDGHKYRFPFLAKMFISVSHFFVYRKIL